MRSMSLGQRREIRIRPQGQKHQADEEKGGKSHDTVNHFPFGNEVHEIAGDQESLGAGDEQSDADVQRGMPEGNIRGGYRDDRAE